MTIAYTMVGTNDLARAEQFYSRVLAVLGMLKHAGYSSEKRIWFTGASGAPPMFVVTKPYDELSATVGNGSMVAFSAPSRALVEEAFKVALAEGARDEGAPGLRGDTFYGAYCRDLDGNKMALFTTARY